MAQISETQRCLIALSLRMAAEQFAYRQSDLAKSGTTFAGLIQQFKDQETMARELATLIEEECELIMPE